MRHRLAVAALAFALAPLPAAAHDAEAAQAATAAVDAAKTAATGAATSAAQAATSAATNAATDAAKAAVASATGAAPAGSGFQTDLLADYGYITGHLVQLAEAMPADKYGWRPGEGVRSFGEVVGHVAAGNYLGAAAMGTATPAGVDPMKLESVTDKAQAIANLMAAIAHFQQAIGAVAAADLDTQVELFGMKLSKRRVMLIMQGHAHEHTGQAIAYARMNGVVPPWSQPKASN
jgi:uncharacterized damage-inducible protein DinB